MSNIDMVALQEKVARLEAENAQLKKKREAEPTEAFFRSEVQRLQAQVKTYKTYEGRAQVLSEQIYQLVEGIEPAPVRPWQPGKPATETKMSAVLELGDWHIGEVISANETEGFGAYDYGVAQDRALHIAESFMDWVALKRHAFRVPKLYILGLADWISGDIHRELVATNEFPVPEQAIRAGDLLARVVSYLAPHFDEVHFVQVEPDNHSRLQPKPQFKEKARNSMSYVTYAYANALLKKHGNINVINNHRIKELVSIDGVNVLCEHGDTVKAWMGIPYYGFERLRGKEASKRMQAMLDAAKKRVGDEVLKYQKEIGFDYMATAHFHVGGVVSWNILMNGSLCGTTEFDHGCGRHAPPHQVSFMMHPKYKLFDWTPWIPAR